MEIESLIEEGLQRYSRLVLDHEHLRGEFEASVSEFFGEQPAGGPVRSARETVLAARRHIEWFVFERHSPLLRKTPVEGLLGEWHEAVSRPVSELAESFFGSFTGVFRVTSIAEGGGGWVRDLAGYGEHPVQTFPSDQPVVEGDLLVGRLYPMEGEACAPSTAAFVVRAPELVESIQADLERTRLSQSGSRVLHISQLQLERMFWGARSLLLAPARDAAAPDADLAPAPIEEARDWLVESGLTAEEVDIIFGRLARAPFEARAVALGGEDELGTILDEMAFTTDLDLTEARRLLVLSWAALANPTANPTDRTAGDSEPSEAEPGIAGEAGGAKVALAAFEDGRKAGRDLNDLFGDLERDLGLEGGDSDDDPESPAPDFPGVVGAMIEEFLWETREVAGEAEQAERFAILRSLGRFGEHIGVFEELSGADLLRFSAFWLAERRELANAADAENLVDALEGFCAWAETAHEMPLNAEFGETLAKLRLSLPRITEANLKLAASTLDAARADEGELYEVVAARPPSTLKLIDRRGREHTASAPEELSPLVQSGDRLRGRIELDGQAVVYCLYPPEAGGLLSS